MSRFTTRVELHDASWLDYNTLHAAMEQEGFRRTITDESGTEYHLPTAEYNLEGFHTRSQVLAKAERAAAQTGKLYLVLVTESNGRTWANLVPVRATARSR